jgi:hypothetical protein
VGLQLSALVCVTDRASGLAECLRGLAFCDEIIVVADRGAERTLEIARRAGAKAVTGVFPLESQRRQAGIAACGGDWILEIEPDERVSSALAWEIRARLKLGPEGDYFEAPVHNYLGEDLVRQGWTSALGETTAVRLYRPGVKRWEARRRDPGQAVAGRCAGDLKGAIRREAGRDVNELVEAFNRRTALRAQDHGASGPGPRRRGRARRSRAGRAGRPGGLLQLLPGAQRLAGGRRGRLPRPALGPLSGGQPPEGQGGAAHGAGRGPRGAG